MNSSSVGDFTARCQFTSAVASTMRLSGIAAVSTQCALAE